MGSIKFCYHQKEVSDMHAVVFQVDMKNGWERKVEAELGQLVTMVKSVSGFVRGTWTTDGRAD